MHIIWVLFLAVMHIGCILYQQWARCRYSLQSMNSQPGSESQSSNLLDGVQTSKTESDIEPIAQSRQSVPRQCPAFKVNIQMGIVILVSLFAFTILVVIALRVVPRPALEENASQEQRQGVKRREQFPNWIGRKPQSTPSKEETLQHQLTLIRLQRQLLLLRSSNPKQSESSIMPISQLFQQKDSSTINTWSEDSNSKQTNANIEAFKANASEPVASKPIQSTEKHEHFPRRVWMYIEEGIDLETNLTRLMVANIAEYLKKHGYDFQLIGEYNWHFLMTNQNEHSVGYVLYDLWHIAYETQSNANLKDHTFTIKKQLINLIMLSEMGGIVLDKQVLLMQDLNWLENFDKINVNNKGKCDKPKVVGYYHINYTNLAEEVEISNYQSKELHLYPPLDPYFLAVSRDGVDFIKEVIKVYIDLLEFPEKIEKVIAQLRLSMGEINGKDPYYQSYYVAFASVIRRKQIQFDKQWENSGYKKKRQLAIDHYGIFSLNRVYGPLKYRYIFSDQQPAAIYDFLSKIPYSSLQGQYGKAEYLSLLPFPQTQQNLLVQAQEGNEIMLIDRESFFGRYLFNTVENRNWELKVPLFPVRKVKEGLMWKELPRKVWVYSKEDSYINRLCFESIRAAGIFSEFKVYELRDTHLMGHLGSVMIKRIEEAIRTIPQQLDRKSIIELRVKLVKLATLQSEGGIWMELPSFPLEDFEWLRRIHANSDVLSKKRMLPEVVMFYHPLKSGFPFDCMNLECSVKNDLEILPYFIAAQPKARLIQMWLNEALSNLVLQQTQLQEKFGRYGISITDSKGIKSYFQQTLLTVLRAQSAKIQNFENDYSAFDDLDVWLISSFSGPDKFKQYTNYDKGFNDNNTYLWNIPTEKTKRMLGEFRYFIHLGQSCSATLNQKLIYHFFDLHIHPNSFLSKYLINSQQTFDIKALQLREDSRYTRDILFPKIVWVYISSLHEISEYEQIWLKNTIHHGSDYIVQVVSEENYHEFIEDDIEIRKLLRDVIPRLETSEQVREDIVEQMILYSLLKNNGGLIVSSHCILAESLEWIHQVLDNPFRKELNGKYVSNIAFYSEKVSNKGDVGEQYITEQLRSYFLAAIPNSNFISQLTRSFTLALHLLQKQVQYIPTLQQLNKQVFELFYQSSKARDRALSYQTKMVSIAKYYDISMLDSSLFGEKLNHYSKNQKISLLSNLGLREMGNYIGPINYMLASMDKQELTMIAKIKKPVKYSFFDMILNPEQQPQSQEKEVKKGMFNQSNFPYKVWFYKEMEDTPQLQQSKQVRLRLMCEQTDFSFLAINDENIINHIDQATQSIISSSINKQNKKLDPKIKVQLYKLALMIKEGGIFLSSNLIPTQGLDWIHHLSNKIQVQHRIRESPTLIHFFNDEWINFSVDRRYNLRIVDSSAMSIEFLAATKGNDFLKDLFSQILSLVSLGEKALTQQSSKLALTQISQKFSPQFLLKIAYRQVVNKKAKQLNLQNLKVQGLSLKEFTVIPQYYKILALPLQHGPIKIMSAIEDIGIAQIYNLLCHKQRVVLDQIYGTPRYFVKLIFKQFENLYREGDEECVKDSYFSIYLLKGRLSD